MNSGWNCVPWGMHVAKAACRESTVCPARPPCCQRPDYHPRGVRHAPGRTEAGGRKRPSSRAAGHHPRALLALGSRAFEACFVLATARSNIEGLGETLQGRPALAFTSLALFALGPLPSNQLFIAAGLAKAPLLPILVVFCVARSVSYVLWISAANIAGRSLQELLGPRLGSWGVIALQLAGFGLILLAMRVDWRCVLAARRPGQPDSTRT